MVEARRRVGLHEVVRGLVQMAPQADALARNLPDLLLRRPTSQASIGQIFQKLAAKQPDALFLKAHNGQLTYGQANERANRIAHILKERGVRPGQAIGLMSHNSMEMVVVLLATVKIGAICGLINYHQRGRVLAHSLDVMEPAFVIAEAEFVEHLPAGTSVLTFDQLDDAVANTPRQAAENPSECAQLRAYNKAYYIFTSGTTGLPKASIMSHHRWLQSYAGLGGMGVRLKRDDTLYCCLPLYHNNAVTVALGAVLNAGACMAISRKFSVTNFWDDVIRYDATSFVYIGELCRYLLGQPERPHDRAHRIRVIVGNGLRSDIWREFVERFGIARVAEFYGASECNVAFINAYNIDETAGTTVLPHRVVAYDAETGTAVRDARGRVCRVKPGEVGLLLTKVTKKQPFDGYTDAEASEKKLLRSAFRKGDCWFVTGDLVRHQGLHHVAFVDRLGDTFRWKGENVATTEVEAAFEHVDCVADCAVYGVSVPGADGKAGMAAVVLKPGRVFEPDAVAQAVSADLPGYAVPVFVRIVDSLEHTSTFKSRKVDLQREGYAQAPQEQVWMLVGSTYVRYEERLLAELTRRPNAGGSRAHDTS